MELDELILHVTRHSDVSEAVLVHELNERLVSRVEIHPNRIEFHTLEAMRALQGVGTEIKERKLVDNRPAPTSEPILENAA